MHQMTEVARGRGHISRHERQRLDRAAAFSRRTSDRSTPACPVKLATAELELIDRLVRSDRTAGLDGAAGDRRHRRRRGPAAGGPRSDWCGGRLAVAEGAISSGRAEQIARHITRAIGLADRRSLSEPTRALAPFLAVWLPVQPHGCSRSR